MTFERPPNRHIDQVVPELLDDRDLRQGRLELFDTDWTSREVRPATVLAALMVQAPGDPLQESIEETVPLHEAIEYASGCLTAEETYILNAIDSEGITYDQLAARMNLNRIKCWRMHQRAFRRLSTLLLNHPPVRERLGMEPTWNAAAMAELVGIASYQEDWDVEVGYLPADAAADVSYYIDKAVTALDAGTENRAVRMLSAAAEHAVAYLRSIAKWRLVDQHELLCSKQNDYGHGNILKFGMTGVVVRASDKGERLKNLTAAGAKPRNESLLDTFFDVIGYAVIARMLKAETFELQLESTTSEAEGEAA